jgi:hypothetical protein
MLKRTIQPSFNSLPTDVASLFVIMPLDLSFQNEGAPTLARY